MLLTRHAVVNGLKECRKMAEPLYSDLNEIVMKGPLRLDCVGDVLSSDSLYVTMYQKRRSDSRRCMGCTKVNPKSRVASKIPGHNED